MQNPVITKQQEGLDKLQKNKLSIHTDVKADTCEEKSAHLILAINCFRKYINYLQVSVNAPYAGSSNERWSFVTK